MAYALCGCCVVLPCTTVYSTVHGYVILSLRGGVCDSPGDKRETSVPESRECNMNGTVLFHSQCTLFNPETHVTDAYTVYTHIVRRMVAHLLHLPVCGEAGPVSSFDGPRYGILSPLLLLRIPPEQQALLLSRLLYLLLLLLLLMLSPHP